MSIEQIELSEIQDNPFQPRLTYHRNDIDELTASIKVNGLLQVPVARRKDGKIELGFGHLRKRAFVKLAKENKKWGKMPLDIRELSDQQMALFALEENLKRRDITPIEVARAVDKYLEAFKDKTETDLAAMLNMTQGNVSNMRRVLRLPPDILEKIDQGRISFTMGRELLVFEGLNVGKISEWSQQEKKTVDMPIDAEYLMTEAIEKIEKEGGARQYGYYPPTVDGIQKAIHEVACIRLKTLDKEHAGSGHCHTTLLFDAETAGCSKCDKVLKTHPTKTGVARWCTDITCWDKHDEDHKAEAAKAAKAKMQADILKKVTKPGGPAIISQEIPAGAEEESALQLKADQAEHNAPAFKICITCLNKHKCDGTGVHSVDIKGGGSKLVCDNRMTKENMKEVKEKATMEIPEELLERAKEEMGTRAEILDLRELRVGGGYNHALKQGYICLRGNYENHFQHMDDPDECLKSCTHGFHYAFDSEPSHLRSDEKKQEVFCVCTDAQCLSKKKAAFTRAKNAAGMAKKKAELVAVKQAVEQTTVLDKPRMKLIVTSLLKRNQYSFNASNTAFFSAKLGVKAQEEGGCRLSEDKMHTAIFKALDKFTDQQFAQLIVEFCLHHLMYEGGPENYQIQTTVPLNWMGIGINIEKETPEKKAEGEKKNVKSS